MSFSAYLVGVCLLAGPTGLLAWGVDAWVCRRLGLRGCARVTAGGVLVVAGLILTGEALGLFGALNRAAAAAVETAVGIVLLLLARRGEAAAARARPAVRMSRLEGAVVAGGIACVAGAWSTRIHHVLDAGIVDVDSRRYHMPFAADFIVSGSTTHLHYIENDPTVAFNPANTELLHAMLALPFGRDILSPYVNLAWLALALVAAWTLGARRSAGAACAMSVCALLGTYLLTAGSAGTGGNDAAVAAFLLAAVALALEADGSLGVVAVAAIAAGLAAGTKLYAPTTVVAIAAGMTLLAAPGRRLRTALCWLGGIVAGGGYWTLRNLVITGSPVPGLRLALGPLSLPHPPTPQVELYGPSLLQAGHSLSFWTDHVPSGYGLVVGRAWPVLVLLAAAGVVLALVRGDGRLRVIALAAVVAGCTYVVTPTTASHTQTDPDPTLYIGLNSRYGTPALLLGLLALALSPLLAPGRRRLTLAGLLGAALVYEQLPTTADASVWAAFRSTGVTVAVAVAALGAAALLLRERPRRLSPAMSRALPWACAAAVLVAVAAEAGLQRHFLDGRYAQGGIDHAATWAWARGVHDARIAVAGVNDAYPLYGVDLSNTVTYVGESGPHGAFGSTRSCGEWRAGVDAGDYAYVVTGSAKAAPDSADERGWTEGAPGVSVVERDADVVVFRLSGPLGTAGCPAG